MKQPVKALGSGIAGAAAITLIHEAIRQFIPLAPRMERLGMQGLEKVLNETGQPVPENQDTLYGQALAADLLANSLYYSLVGVGKKPWVTGLITGLGAGIAAVTLPKKLGLDESNANRTPTTTAMTIGLYTLGGLIAGGVASLLTEKTEEKNIQEVNPVFSVQDFEKSWNLKE